MRALTLGQVRELLSGSAATTFVEAWTRADQVRTDALEQIDDLRAQILAAESRVKAADEAAASATTLASALQARLLKQPADAQVRSFAEREVAALARAASSRAAKALDEAGERRRRALQMTGRVQQLQQTLEQHQEERERLRREAARLGGYAGEACLFFGDADRPGGAFVVPLETLKLDNAELVAFVLHRLAPGAALDRAEAVRDAPDPVSEEDETETDLSLTPPPERATHRKRKKEKT